MIAYLKNMPERIQGLSGKAHTVTYIEDAPETLLESVKKFLGLDYKTRPMAVDVLLRPANDADVTLLYTKALDGKLDRAALIATGFSELARVVAEVYGAKLGNGFTLIKRPYERLRSEALE